MNKRKKKIEKDVLARVLNFKGYSTPGAITGEYYAWIEVPEPLLRIDWSDPHMISWILTMRAGSLEQHQLARRIGETMDFEANTWASELAPPNKSRKEYWAKEEGKKFARRLWKKTWAEYEAKKSTFDWAITQLLHYARYEEDSTVLPDIILHAMIKSNRTKPSAQANVDQHKVSHRKALIEWRNTP